MEGDWVSRKEERSKRSRRQEQEHAWNRDHGTGSGSEELKAYTVIFKGMILS